MVKKTSPKSSNINIKEIQKQLVTIQDEFKSSKKKITRLEKDNKSLVSNLKEVTNWKKKYELPSNDLSNEKDLTKNLPYVLLDLMKNINNLNDFNLNLINEIKSPKKRKYNSDSEDSSDEESDYEEYDDKTDIEEISNDEISEGELNDLKCHTPHPSALSKNRTNSKKKHIIFDDEKNKEVNERIKEEIKIKRELDKFIKYHKMFKKFKSVDYRDKSLIYDYLELYLKNEKLRQLSKKDLLYFFNLSLAEKTSIYNTEIGLNNLVDKSVPPRFKIINSSLPLDIKSKCLQKLTKFDNCEPGSGEYNKLSDWINGLLSIPWNTYKTLPVNINTKKDREIFNYLEEGMKQLDKCVYGQNKTKQHMIQLVSKMISNPNSVGNVFSIYGPMGTGKTTIIKEGLSKLLGLPFIFISLGGSSDSSFLDGHSYTYEGSIPGRIVEALKTAKSMNPIFYFDELDKVSNTSRGLEIINLLIHLTDPAQNSHYHDKYYGDIPFDLSKALFVFSFNDINKVNPILKDRMNLIKVDSFTQEEKFVISKDFLLPCIKKEYFINNDEIIFSDDIIKYIITKNQSGISTEQQEEGVRGIKRRMEIIISNLNVIKIAFMKNKSTPLKQVRKRRKKAVKQHNLNTNNTNNKNINNKNINDKNINDTNKTGYKTETIVTEIKSKETKNIEEDLIDIEMIKKILPHIKQKLDNNSSNYIQKTIKNIKIPINVSIELVDLFISSNLNTIPFNMYT